MEKEEKNKNNTNETVQVEENKKLMKKQITKRTKTKK